MDETPRSPEGIPNWSPPLAGKLVAKSKPGDPRDYPPGSHRVHQGIDLPAPLGTPVQSIGDGKVVTVVNDWVPGQGADKFGGNFIIIQHPNGVRSKYMHLSEIDVKVGQTVTGAEQIGKTGDTGGKRAGDAAHPAMYPHLHFAIEDTDPATGKTIRDPVTKKDKNFDPVKFLKLDSTSSPGKPYGTSTGESGGGFLSKLREFFGAHEPDKDALAHHLSEDDLTRLKDIASRVIENERKLGHVTDDDDQQKNGLDKDGTGAIKQGHDLAERWRRNNVQYVPDAGASLQQKLNMQRLQQMTNEQARHSQQLLRDIQDRNELQANLARGVQRRLAEQSERNSQIRQQLADEQRRQSIQRTQDVLKQQADARRNEEIRMAQQRAAEQARRNQQQLQNQLNRTMAVLNSRPQLPITNHFTRPFVSPTFAGHPATTIQTSPLHLHRSSRSDAASRAFYILATHQYHRAPDLLSATQKRQGEIVALHQYAQKK